MTGAAPRPDTQRRERLLSVKLAAIVRDRLGNDVEIAPGEFGGGAALITSGRVWVLLDDRPARGLGAAIAWAIRRDAVEVNLVAETDNGLLARRAMGWRTPIHVWKLAGRELTKSQPDPLPIAAELPKDHALFEGLIRSSGAEPIVEHGVLRGEVDGLEVCRVVTDEVTGSPRLEVGVGAHDREAFQLLHGDRPGETELAAVVAAVSQYRRTGVDRHPLNLLAQERSLRCRLVAQPSLVGASEVRLAPPPVPRSNIKDPVPCVAIATIAGSEVTLVCSAGVDLDVVPFAIDAVANTGTNECLVVLPARDAIDIQHRLAASAPGAITIRAVN